MSTFTIPNVFVANTKIKSASMNANFSAIAATFNTNLLPAIGNTNALVTTDSGGNLQSVLPIGTEGQTLVVDPTATSTGGLRFTTPSSGAGASEIYNLGLKAVATAGALAINLVQGDGVTAPGPGTASVLAAIRNPVSTVGGYNQRTVVTPLAMSISTGTTLGMLANQDNNLWHYLVDTDGAGTMALAASTLRYDEGTLQSIVPETQATTINIGTSTFTSTAHGFNTNDAVTFTTTGALPTGLTAGMKYWVEVVDSNNFQVQHNPADGGIVGLSGSQSGVHSVHVAGTRIVSNAAYLGVAVRFIGKSVYNLVSQGSWLNPIEVSLAGALIYDELVAAKYTSSTATVTNGGGATGLTVPTLGFDTHGILDGTSSGRFTCPVSGTYNVEGAYQSSSTISPTAVNAQVYMFVVVNSTVQQYIHILTSQVSGVPFGLTGQGSLLLQVNAGDIIQVQLMVSGSMPTFSLDGSSQTSYVAFTRLASKPV